MKQISTAKYAFVFILAFGLSHSLLAQTSKEQAVLTAEIAIGNICDLVYTKAAALSANGLPCERTTDAYCFTTGCKPYSSTQVFPLTVYLSIPENCPFMTQRGDTISGRIDMTFSGTVAQTGTATVSVVLTNIKINGLRVAGNLAVTANRSTNQALSLTAKSTNFNVTAPNGQSLFFTDLTYTLTQVGGQASKMVPSYLYSQNKQQAAYTDDSFDITINGTAKDNTGTTVIVATTTPLHRVNTCEWTVSGILECTVGSLLTKINYGTGTCDNLVTVTVGTKSKTMQLP